MKKNNIIAILTAFFAGLGMGYVLIREKVKPAIREIIGKLVEEMAEEIYPCKLIATIRFNQESPQTIVDMSRYNSMGIVGLTVDKTEAPESEEDEALDGQPIIYSPAVVYRLRGHWLWKVL